MCCAYLPFIIIIIIQSYLEKCNDSQPCGISSQFLKIFHEDTIDTLSVNEDDCSPLLFVSGYVTRNATENQNV